MSRVAFYAPIKPPDHPIPSGDRLIAGNLMKSLKLAGFDVELASRFIAYSKRDAPEILEQRKSAAEAEAEGLIETLRGVDLFLTYHPYCKAPDWIGPIVSQVLDIPYVTVEAAKTGQGFENGQDRWRQWRTEAQVGIRSADLHLVFKPSDWTYLEGLLGSDEKLRRIPPFINIPDANAATSATLPSHWRKDAPVLITTAMMRPGKKTRNFKILSESLQKLQSLHWNLVVVGGGPEEDTIQDLFAAFDQSRLLFTGAVNHSEVLAYMASSDIFVWPGWKEPIGMVYLEAQSMGLPVVALNSMGVPLVVKQGETGLLAESPDVLRDSIATMISHPSLRHDMAAAAPSYVAHHHSVAAAAVRLQSSLAPLLQKS